MRAEKVLKKLDKVHQLNLNSSIDLINRNRVDKRAFSAGPSGTPWSQFGVISDTLSSHLSQPVGEVARTAAAI